MFIFMDEKGEFTVKIIRETIDLYNSITAQFCNNVYLILKIYSSN